uniref:Uncharacterized protein n=1 Tax=Accipiter nisus TaxID=211598 RepID=A0A8B9NKT3_9AVES
DENFSSWEKLMVMVLFLPCCLCLRFLMLFFLALLLSCGICCCLRCWLKRRSCLPHRRTLAVFALSSSDAFCVSPQGGPTQNPPKFLCSHFLYMEFVVRSFVMPCFKNYIHAFLVSKRFGSSSQAHPFHPQACSSLLSAVQL